MTGLEKIVEQILEEANTQSDMILEDAQKKTSDMKAESKGQAAEVLSGADVKADDIKKIVFACDAGMGLSLIHISEPTRPY